MKLQFSGHESFICKQFWLKKGYDFVANSGNFNDESAVVDLGVGKNMVASISYWLKAFGITDQSNNATTFGDYIFNDKNGVDPYIESIGTLWLLHYNLVKIGKASIYSIFFNQFRRGKTEFTKDQLARFCFKLAEQDGKVNLNTINSDIAVFIRNYLVANNQSSKSDIEDEFSNLMIDLELMQSYQAENAEEKKVEWYSVENIVRPDLPSEIILYSMLDNQAFGKSIPFRELMTGYNSPGAVFALNEEGMYQKIEQIIHDRKNIVYKENAGVRELQIKNNIIKEEILNDYYKD